MHISKPWWDEAGLLIVNAINSTAGLFSGDIIGIHHRGKIRRPMLVTSPSATRAHRMPSGDRPPSANPSASPAAHGWSSSPPSSSRTPAAITSRKPPSISIPPPASSLSRPSSPAASPPAKPGNSPASRAASRLTYNSRPIARETYSLNSRIPLRPGPARLYFPPPATPHATQPAPNSPTLSSPPSPPSIIPSAGSAAPASTPPPSPSASSPPITSN